MCTVSRLHLAQVAEVKQGLPILFWCTVNLVVFTIHLAFSFVRVRMYSVYSTIPRQIAIPTYYLI